ncbi:MAG: SDR family oxidoreductase [Gammaproteobacteria bacterium]|nr:MAG: SDR family oxidoreductase [Gammaproteobacteria bacterium]
MSAILVTGSNRGLGLEWVRQYAEAGWHVHATCRHPDKAHDLKALAARHPHITLHRLDVTRPEEIREVAGALRGQAIDVLVNNAGVYLEKYDDGRLGHIDFAAWEETFRVNTLGPVRVTAAFLEHVARSAKRLVVAISSHMGAIAEIDMPGSYAYRSSKAALNAAMKGISLELRPRGIGVLLLHPGWVRTRMGGPDAPLLPEESVSAMRRLVEGFTMAMSGRFFRYNGTEIPW